MMLGSMGAVTLVFSAWRNGNPLNPNNTPLLPGDTFQVTITGASPNSGVSVARSDGATAQMNPTDAAGNLVYNGSITSGYPVGSFQETWFVNAVPVGSYNFSIGTAGQQQSTGQQSGGTGPMMTPACSGLSLGGTCIPYLGIGVAVAGLVLLMMGGRR